MSGAAGDGGSTGQGGFVRSRLGAFRRSRAISDAAFSLGVSVVAVLVALAISIGVIAAFGGPPWASLHALWTGAFGGRSQIAGTLNKMIPLLLVALGWIVAFSTKRINIGFEGQILVGGIAAVVVGLKVHAPAPIPLALGVIAGIGAGGIYAAIPAWLWARRHVNEIISTLMLNFVAIQLVSWLVRGPLQEPTRGFPFTSPVLNAARWPALLHGTDLHWDFAVALAMAFAVQFLLKRTSFGMRLRVTGGNEPAARSAGIRTRAVAVVALVLSGMVAGLAGTSLILAGATGTMTDSFSANYGFDGIVAALLARNSALGAIPAALLLAALRQGGGVMEAQVGTSSALVQITQGLVVVLVAGSGWLIYRRRSVRVDTDAPAVARGPERPEPTAAEAVVG